MAKMIWRAMLLAGAAMSGAAGAQTRTATAEQPGEQSQADVVVTALRDANASITGTDTPRTAIRRACASSTAR